MFTVRPSAAPTDTCPPSSQTGVPFRVLDVPIPGLDRHPRLAAAASTDTLRDLGLLSGSIVQLRLASGDGCSDAQQKRSDREEDEAAKDATACEQRGHSSRRSSIPVGPWRFAQVWALPGDASGASGAGILPDGTMAEHGVLYLAPCLAQSMGGCTAHLDALMVATGGAGDAPPPRAQLRVLMLGRGGVVLSVPAAGEAVGAGSGQRTPDDEGCPGVTPASLRDRLAASLAHPGAVPPGSIVLGFGRWAVSNGGGGAAGDVGGVARAGAGSASASGHAVATPGGGTGTTYVRDWAVLERCVCRAASVDISLVRDVTVSALWREAAKDTQLGASSSLRGVGVGDGSGTDGDEPNRPQVRRGALCGAMLGLAPQLRFL